MSFHPSPKLGEMQPGMSASQLGLYNSRKKFFDVNPKKLIITCLIAVITTGVIFMALVAMNIIALSGFKTVAHTSSKGTGFKLDFYTKHGSKQLQTGSTQLVSKVSKDGKFPIVLSISTTDEMSAYNRVKNCTGFTKVFEVHNNNMNQNVSSCDVGKQGQLPTGNVYVAGFTQDDLFHIATISQDYGSINLSSQSDAQESLTKFGMDPYKADIERIISSIKVE